MDPFLVKSVAWAVAHLSQARAALEGNDTIVEISGNTLKEVGFHNVEGWKRGMLARIRKDVAQEIATEALENAKNGLVDVPLSDGLRRRITRLEQKVIDLSVPSSTLEVLIHELLLDVLAELSDPLFLCVYRNKREYYEQKAPLFGQEVADVFPDASRDIAAAGRCYAVEEWTACVFHLMRVLEHGLRPIAARFAVPFAQDSWHKVIKGIEEALSDLRNKPNLIEQDRKEITYYSDAASQFRHFKDAWRNHVSHAREHYDDKDADKVMTHVSEFMRQLAKPV